MPTSITSSSFLSCFYLSKVYIGKDTFIGKIDLSNTKIKEITTPEQYDPKATENVIAIGDKTVVKLSKEEEVIPDPQIVELNNTINNLNQDLTQEKLDKVELQRIVGQLDQQIKVLESTKNNELNNTLKSLKDLQDENKKLVNQVSTLTTQLNGALQIDELVFNLLSQHSNKKVLLERTQEVVQKVNDLNSSITNLNTTIKNKDEEITRKNNQINSLQGQVNNPPWIDKFVNVKNDDAINRQLINLFQSVNIFQTDYSSGKREFKLTLILNLYNNNPTIIPYIGVEYQNNTSIPLDLSTPKARTVSKKVLTQLVKL